MDEMKNGNLENLDNEEDMEEMEDDDLVIFETEDGEELTFSIEDYFFYNGEEYAALRDAESEEAGEDPAYIMKVNAFTDENGEEMEEFVLPDESLLETLAGVLRTKFETEAE
jgi:uncharacterized protein YrzB (UPF0473 family)